MGPAEVVRRLKICRRWTGGSEAARKVPCSCSLQHHQSIISLASLTYRLSARDHPSSLLKRRPRRGSAEHALILDYDPRHQYRIISHFVS